MNPARQALFEPLRLALQQREMFDYDFLELLAGFANTQPVIAHAMALHAAHFLRHEGTEAMGWNTVIAEVYRRTFFETEGERYGAEAMDDEQAWHFAEHMTGLLKMDAMQEAADQGNYHATPAAPQ